MRASDVLVSTISLARVRPHFCISHVLMEERTSAICYWNAVHWPLHYQYSELLRIHGSRRCYEQNQAAPVPIVISQHTPTIDYDIRTSHMRFFLLNVPIMLINVDSAVSRPSDTLTPCY